MTRAPRSRGLDALEGDPRLKVFHAGTRAQDGRILANGGRVLNVTALGGSVAEAQERAYEAVARIDWPQGFCRSDIGWACPEALTRTVPSRGFPTAIGPVMWCRRTRCAVLNVALRNSA